MGVDVLKRDFRSKLPVNSIVPLDDSEAGRFKNRKSSGWNRGRILEEACHLRQSAEATQSYGFLRGPMYGKSTQARRQFLWVHGPSTYHLKGTVSARHGS